MFNVQRRMGDWSEDSAQTWEDLLAAHDKWMKDYNFQKHLAHDKREDGSQTSSNFGVWAILGSMTIPTLAHNCPCGNPVKSSGMSLYAAIRLAAGTGVGEVSCCNCRCTSDQRVQRPAAMGKGCRGSPLPAT